MTDLPAGKPPLYPPELRRRVFHLMEQEVQRHGPHLPPLDPSHVRRARALALIKAADEKAAAEAAAKAQEPKP